MPELSKAYEPKKYEDDIYKMWEQARLFEPEVSSPKDAQDYFSIVLPPPNVTGTLHMGHAAMLAIEDVMARYHRMQGERTLWVPGTDHAAVATESKVENLLIKEEGFKKPKEELGREQFLQRVNKFAQESHDTIVNQAKKMGASLDWSREAYTLDDVRSRAVRLVFKKMYDDGLIYRGYRVINWSVKGQSTCSDDELMYVERPAKLYYFKYSTDFPITIATTRPETKLGDTAVAVNPNDERYQKYIGQTFIVDVGAEKPLQIKIIGSESVDPGFGTGALGVTPAHSAADFDMYLKQKEANDPIGLIQVIGEDGKMTVASGSAYAGLKVTEAREKFVEYLRAQNLLEKEEDLIQNVGTSDRFGDVVEALPKTQWFVDVNKKFRHEKRQVSLKQLMQEVVREGQIKIIPERFEKTYFSWIDNLRDWCISRQIWFGHQIPVWYCESGKMKDAGEKCDLIVSSETIVSCPQCGGNVEQDPDTLDTWFSSGLWTFSTLLDKNIKLDESLADWVARSADIKNFHPTSVLETGYDIIFFWVARMILMTTYALGEVPFKTVYLHGLVRDEQGRKMSKSLGNIINPLDMIDRYGTDATRLSLLLGSTPGNDMKLSEEKIAGFRNFTNKLWNIARFMLLQMGEKELVVGNWELRPKTKTLADEWVLAKFNDVIGNVTKAIEEYQFSAAGEMLREFTWDTLADWYLEVAKIEGGKEEILAFILERLLKLWHPYMPFVTEAIWREWKGDTSALMVERWPQNQASTTMRGEAFEVVRQIIAGIRTKRAEQKIEPAKKIDMAIKTSSEYALVIEKYQSVIQGLRTGVGNLVIGAAVEPKAGSVMFATSGMEIYLDLSGAIDTEKEKARITKDLADTERYVAGLTQKLSNEQFVSNAPTAVVALERKKLAEAEEKLRVLREQAKNL